MPSLFADYLSFVRGPPNNGLRRSRSHTQLVVLAGGPSYTRGPSLATLPYWDAYRRGDSKLDAWLGSGMAFVPPTRWPEGFPFPAHLTPFDFAYDAFPRARAKDNFPFGSTRYNHWALDTPHVHVLAAYAHGWPLVGKETAQAKAAAETLMTRPRFLLYCMYDIHHLPLPFYDTSYIDRVASREILNENPLWGTSWTLRNGLPTWCRTPEQLAKHGVPRTEVTGSTLRGHLLDAAGGGSRLTR